MSEEDVKDSIILVKPYDPDKGSNGKSITSDEVNKSNAEKEELNELINSFDNGEQLRPLGNVKKSILSTSRYPILRHQPRFSRGGQMEKEFSISSSALSRDLNKEIDVENKSSYLSLHESESSPAFENYEPWQLDAVKPGASTTQDFSQETQSHGTSSSDSCLKNDTEDAHLDSLLKFFDKNIQQNFNCGSKRSILSANKFTASKHQSAIGVRHLNPKNCHSLKNMKFDDKHLQLEPDMEVVSIESDNLSFREHRESTSYDVRSKSSPTSHDISSSEKMKDLSILNSATNLSLSKEPSSYTNLSFVGDTECLNSFEISSGDSKNRFCANSSKSQPCLNEFQELNLYSLRNTLDVDTTNNFSNAPKKTHMSMNRISRLRHQPPTLKTSKSRITGSDGNIVPKTKL